MLMSVCGVEVEVLTIADNILSRDINHYTKSPQLDEVS